jgi:hypothetical protein
MHSLLARMVVKEREILAEIPTWKNLRDKADKF